MATSVVIATATTVSNIDTKYMLPDERAELGKQQWRAIAEAIVSLGIQATYCVELKMYDDGFWSVVLSRRDKRPVAADLGNMTLAQWLARERMAALKL